jgi:deoxyhypusine monooxygenase
MSTTETPALIATLQSALQNESLPLAQRYRALFGLKHHACQHPPTAYTHPAIAAIASAFATPSALLKHELAYCLGQTRHAEAAAPALRKALLDFAEDDMVRHESAEALGALGDVYSLQILKERRDDGAEKEVVRETCEIAVGRIEWEGSLRGKEGRVKER